MSKSVLFVCLGNICRSPTAEAVFRKKVEDAGMSDRIHIDSAGIISAHEGEPADARMRKHALARGLKLESISRPVRAADFEEFDLIIGMDRSNIRDLEERAPNPAARSRISLLMSYAAESSVTEVPDPYYGGAAGFEEVLDLVDAATEGLLQQLQHEC